LAIQKSSLTFKNDQFERDDQNVDESGIGPQHKWDINETIGQRRITAFQSRISIATEVFSPSCKAFSNKFTNGWQY